MHPTLRETAGRLARVALQAADPAAAIKRMLRREGNDLQVADRRYDLAQVERLFVVSAGKAAPAMALALQEALDRPLEAGLIVTSHGLARGLTTPLAPPWRLIAAGHPVPDEGSVAGGEAAAALLARATPRDLVFCLISGGGSALLARPASGISLHDLQTTTDLLLRSGATINELNALRKHLDLVKGGGLAGSVSGAPLVALILSDVMGDPLDVIASGPTVADPTTFAEAWQVVTRYNLVDRLPAGVRERLQAGLRGDVPETLKADDARLAGVQNVIVGSNRLAAEAVAAAAEAEGYHTLLLSTFVEGEAREVARVAAALAKEVITFGRPVRRPACLIWGGETTVTVRGSGLGGRNQELALATALAIAGLPVGVMSLATDGIDGPTDAAGAWADGSTLSRAEALGLNAAAALDNNDAYHFFAKLDDLLITGPSGTNVNDILMILAA